MQTLSARLLSTSARVFPPQTSRAEEGWTLWQVNQAAMKPTHYVFLLTRTCDLQLSKRPDPLKCTLTTKIIKLYDSFLIIWISYCYFYCLGTTSSRIFNNKFQVFLFVGFSPTPLNTSVTSLTDLSLSILSLTATVLCCLWKAKITQKQDQNRD